MAHKGKCEIEGCPNTRIVARGWCQTHYYRWRWHGDPLAGRFNADVLGRFLAKVRMQEDGCWLWFGAINREGYGHFYANGKQILAHRWAYQHYVGPIPEGLLVLHHCDTPGCVRPEHLFTGSQTDNMRDRWLKGRYSSAAGEKNGRAKLTAEQVAEIRTRYTGARGEQTALAREYGVSPGQVWAIVNARSWPVAA